MLFMADWRRRLDCEPRGWGTTSMVKKESLQGVCTRDPGSVQILIFGLGIPRRTWVGVGSSGLVNS